METEDVVTTPAPEADHITPTGRKYKYIAKNNCKRCYGRGFVGTNIITKELQFCTCLRAIELPALEQAIEQGDIKINEDQTVK